MKKHIILLTLLLLPLLASAQITVKIGDLVYNIYTQTRTAEVSHGDFYEDPNNYYYGNIVIPTSITYQGVNYPVTRIGTEAFFCSAIHTLTVPNSVTSIGEKAFFFSGNLESVILPDNLTSIEASAFSRCDRLKTLDIPSSVRSIGEGAFFGCHLLPSVTIPPAVTSIESNTFKNCYSLTTVNIPDNITFIGQYAFEDCKSLSSVTIGRGVQTIKNQAFAGCTSLQIVTCLAEQVPTTNLSAFENSNIKNATLQVPLSLQAAYAAQAPWNEFMSITDRRKCAKPVITYADGIVKATSPTEGSHCTITYLTSATTAGTNSVKPAILILAEAFATADGYEQSETVTKYIYLNGIDDLSGDDKLSIEDLTRLVNRIKEQNKK